PTFSWRSLPSAFHSNMICVTLISPHSHEAARCLENDFSELTSLLALPRAVKNICNDVTLTEGTGSLFGQFDTAFGVTH
ncbi:MAG: hypothetical protein JSW55_03055, partial [Chloroflexota bacterium]